MFRLFETKTKGLSMEEAKKELEQDAAIVLIDVRTPQEYQSGHIPGSVNVPLDQIRNAEGKIPSADTRVFVYCLSGGRSKVAASILSGMGYRNVTNIGGISDWKYELSR